MLQTLVYNLLMGLYINLIVKIVLNTKGIFCASILFLELKFYDQRYEQKY
jgi:hypothetical protein